MTTTKNDLTAEKTVIEKEIGYLEKRGFDVEFPSGGESFPAVLVRAEKESTSKKGERFRAAVSCVKTGSEEAATSRFWVLTLKINEEHTRSYRSRNFAALISYLDREIHQ